MRAHQKPRSKEGFWNNRTDALVKQGALLTQSEEEEEVISVVTRAQKQVTSPERLDLQALQEDEEIEQFLRQGIIRGKWHVHKDSEGVVWVTTHGPDLGEQPS